MNKQELIKKYKRLEGVWDAAGAETARQIFLQDLDQLDEPQKVKIPQFVADVIEDLREDSSELEQAFQSAWWYESDEFTEWYKKKSNRNVFGLAWLGGYEVEKEKRYLVRLKNIEGDIYIASGKYSESWFLNNGKELVNIRTKHTRKELEEAGFGEVFNSPLFEVEEVE